HRLEDPGGLTDPVRDADDRDLGFTAIMRDTGDDRLLHGTSLLRLGDPGAVLVRKRRSYMHSYVLPSGVLDTAEVQDLGATGGHLQHLLITDRGDPARGRHDPRVGGEDAVHV